MQARTSKNDTVYVLRRGTVDLFFGGVYTCRVLSIPHSRSPSRCTKDGEAWPWNPKECVVCQFEDRKLHKGEADVRVDSLGWMKLHLVPGDQTFRDRVV